MIEEVERGAEPDWRAVGLRRLLLIGGLVFLGVEIIVISNWLAGRIAIELVLALASIPIAWIGSGLVPVRRVVPHLILPGLTVLAGVFTGFSDVGFAGGPVVGCLALVVLAAVFTSRRVAIAVGILISAMVAGVGALLENGVLTLQPLNPFAAPDAASWLRVGMVSTFLVGIIVATLDWLLNRMTEQFAEETRASRTLVRERLLRERADQSRVQAEKALATSREAEAIGRLAGGIAHDFNNQLQVFVGWSELLEDLNEKERAELIEEGLEDIGRAARQSAELSRQLSSMSSAQTQSPGTTDLCAFLDAQAKTFRRLLPEDIDLFCDCPTGLNANLNEGRTHQVLLNLVLNARDAMPAGGILRVVARSIEAADIPEGTTAKGAPGWLELSVSDRGVGIEDETLERIFEPFFTTKGEGGTGLGLANVYGIVTAGGGTLRVQSRIGEGTTFSVYLPTAEPSDALEEEVATAEGRGGRVLLVDDREDVREVLAETLRGAGYDVQIAVDADDGIDELERIEGDVDLLVTDAIMPGKSVLVLIEAYQQSFPEGAVLICSGHIEEDLLRRGIRSGDYAFMAKPFETVDFLEEVNALLLRSVGSRAVHEAEARE